MMCKKCCGDFQKLFLEEGVLCRWLKPVISGGTDMEAHGLTPAQRNGFVRPYLKKPFTKNRLVEWLKVQALISNPSTKKQKEQEKEKRVPFFPILLPA
jgi:hypothetical protein